MNELEKINNLKIIGEARCPLCGLEVYKQDLYISLERDQVSARWLCKACGATYEAELELIDGKVYARSGAVFTEVRHNEIPIQGDLIWQFFDRKEGAWDI